MIIFSFVIFWIGIIVLITGLIVSCVFMCKEKVKHGIVTAIITCFLSIIMVFGPFLGIVLK